MPPDAIAHFFCYFECFVLTIQLPQHYTCKTKHHFPYTIVPAPTERKQLHESGNSTHEPETILNTNFSLSQTIKL